MNKLTIERNILGEFTIENNDINEFNLLYKNYTDVVNYAKSLKGKTEIYDHDSLGFISLTDGKVDVVTSSYGCSDRFLMKHWMGREEEIDDVYSDDLEDEHFGVHDVYTEKELL